MKVHSTPQSQFMFRHQPNDDHTIHVHVTEKISWSSNFLHCTRILMCIRKINKNWGRFQSHFSGKTWTRYRVTIAFSDTTHSRTLMQLCYLTANLGFITTTYVMAYLFMMPSFGTSRFVYKDYN